MMQHFDSIKPLIARLKGDIPTNPLGTNEGRDEYEWVDAGDDDGGRIMPSWNSPFISPYLYRGQTRQYSPCFPTLYRDYKNFPGIKRPSELPPNKRDTYLLAQIRLMEFLSVIEQHPAMTYAHEIGLHVNNIALAQHYGMPTDLIDLTQEHEVALFFASCSPNEEGEWHPVAEGIGIVYRIDITAFVRGMEPGPSEKFFQILEMIGLQTLPRPGEQKACTLKLPLGFDFERLPVDGFTFRHVPKDAEPLAKKFGYGRVLFPPDVLADVGEKIRLTKSVPYILAKQALLEHDCNLRLLETALQTYSQRFADEFGVTIAERSPITLTPKQRKIAEKFVNANKKGFLKRVGVRPAFPRQRNSKDEGPAQQG